MTESFLFKISKILFSKYKENLSSLVIVLPSRRSSLFLTQEFLKFISQPIWLPEFYSIDDFLFTVNDLKRVNNLEFFFEFYNVYRNQVNNPHSIDRSYKWASGLLEDFNEIDKSYIKHDDLFDYLSDVKRIENWYLDINENRNEINDHLSFFEKLDKIYHHLKKKLLSNNIAYSGLSQRLIVDDLDRIEKWLKQNKKQKIIFIGLDALSISQEIIIEHLLKNNLCDIFWDTDTYFIKNLEQESGKFLRKYRKKWPSQLSQIDNDFLKIKKEIDIIGTTKNVNQSKLLGSILNQKIYTAETLKKVAIILPNENLLLPVLESIPKQIKDINITMGYKLGHHPILSVFYDILTLHVNKKNIIVKSKHKYSHYLNSDLLQLLRNPYFKLLLDSWDNKLEENLTNGLRNRNFNYTSYNDIKKITSIDDYKLLILILSDHFKDSAKLIDCFLRLVSALLELITDESQYTMIEQECLFEIEQQLLVFQNFLETTSEKISIKLFNSLFNKAIQSVKLNFSGEPLNGIQIMGLLESRAIDFDEIFILSANEGELPPSSNTNSFIPFDVKLKFNIRTSLDSDAIYSNHFFNLIKRPKYTHIIYNQDISYSSGERSRFINQLVYEIKSLPNTGLTIRETVSMDQFILDNKKTQSVFKLKDKYVIDSLIALCKKGLSPSTINMYNYCKKQFYFQKILGISKNEDYENTIDKAKLGSIIHRVLQKLYEPYIHICLDNQIMKNIEKSISKEIKSALKYYCLKNLDRGKNLLAIEAINRIISNFISNESNLVNIGNKITVEFLEYETPLENFPYLLNQNYSETINLKGQIDRIDIFNDCYRIIDYKTGSVKDADLKTINLSEIKSKPKILQLLLYAWLFSKKTSIKKLPIFTGVINLRARNFDFQKCCINKEYNIGPIVLEEFEKELAKIFKDMFNPKKNFEHLDREEKCRFCD